MESPKEKAVLYKMMPESENEYENFSKILYFHLKTFVLYL